MAYSRRAICTVTAALAVLASPGLSGASGAQREPEVKKPSLSLKVSPPVGFSPLKVRLSVDVRGGADDHVDFYCPSIEWAWGDDLVSASSEDCEPYEPGKSEIKRRYSVEHTFRYSGTYRVVFRLKQKDRMIAAASADVQVRAGARDEFGN